VSNPFYTPSGNPATGAEGLSAIIRAEFVSIGTAFDSMPSITTTGVFNTVFAQLGNFTFTLPSAPGTLAMTSDVATETTRAEAAEVTNATAISTETTRAETAEGVNATAIATETSRAETAEALLAPKASPALTGAPTAPTASPGTNTTQIATTAFSAAAVAVETTRAETAEALLAPKASPTFTGTPIAPTAAAGTNTTQIATTAFAETAVAVPIASLAALQGFRNSIINGGFEIWQRGTSVSLTGAGGFYGPDGFQMGTDGNAVTTVSQVAVALTETTVLAAGLFHAMSYVVSGTTTGDTFRQILSRIENPRTLAGQTVRATFWAKADSNRSVGCFLSVHPGTGGSPIGGGDLTGFTASLTASYQQFSHTFTLPAASTITPGTNGDGYLELLLSPPLNTALTIVSTGVSLEIDTGAVTAFEARPPSVELAMAQRYYQTGGGTISNYCAVSSNASFQTIQTFPTMRTAPTSTVVLSGGTNYTSSSIPITSKYSIVVSVIGTAVGTVSYNFGYTADASL
jgi:hypothetical protein